MTTTTAPFNKRDYLVRRMLGNPVAAGSLVVIVLIVGASLAAPWLSHYDPHRTDLASVLLPVSGDHVLGTDALGRDIFSRILYGGRLCLGYAAIAVAVAVLVGLPTGLVAGYHGRRLGSVLDALAEIILSVPAQLLLIAMIAAVGPKMPLAMCALGVLIAPSIHRLLRTTVTTVRREPYIDAARVAGLGPPAILRNHILPVVRGPLIVMTSLSAGTAILMQTALDFLGLGTPDSTSWGSMLSSGFAQINRAPQLVLWPALILSVLLCAVALFGSALRDLLGGTGPRRIRRQARSRPAPASVACAAKSDTSSATMTDGPLLVVRDLTIGFDSPDGHLQVVKGVSFDIARGEILGLVGESGAGKTQTAYSVLGLLPPTARVTSTTMTFAGMDLSDPRRRDRSLLGRRIAYIPQEPLSNLDPAFTIGRQLVEPLRRVHGLSRDSARSRALELMARMEIRDPEAVYRRYPHEVSGGMAQRVLIAGAVSGTPDLIVADEPTTALDVTVQAEILRLLRRLRDENGVSILLVTHNFGVVADLCDRVVVMCAGEVEESTTTQEIFAAPGAEYTRQLLSCELSSLPPRVRGYSRPVESASQLTKEVRS